MLLLSACICVDPRSKDLAFNFDRVIPDPNLLARPEVRQTDLQHVEARGPIGQFHGLAVKGEVGLDSRWSRATVAGALAIVITLLLQLATLQLMKFLLVLDECDS